MALSQRALRRTTQSAFASVKQVPSIVTLAGWKFAALPDQDHRPYNTTFVSIKGEQWVRFEARQGDNNTNETAVERVRLDGFPEGYLSAVNEIEFSLIAGQNCLATRTQEYWNSFEFHARKHPSYPGEYQTRGPLRFSQEWSDGGSQSFFRIWRNYFNTDPPINSGDVTDVMLYSGPNLVEGQRYDFRVHTRQHDTIGYVKVWRNGTLLVDYAGQFGLTSDRPMYPQSGIYRQTRPEPATAYGKIDKILTAADPTPAPPAGYHWEYVREDGALVYENNDYVIEIVKD